MAIAGGIGIIGAVLPWLSLSGEGADMLEAALDAQGEGLSGIGRDGSFTIVLSIVAAVMGGLRLAGKAPKGGAITGIVMGALITLIAIIDLSDVGSVSDDATLAFISVSVSAGVGLWLTLFAGIAILATSILALRSNERS